MHLCVQHRLFVHNERTRLGPCQSGAVICRNVAWASKLCCKVAASPPPSSLSSRAKKREAQRKRVNICEYISADLAVQSSTIISHQAPLTFGFFSWAASLRAPGVVAGQRRGGGAHSASLNGPGHIFVGHRLLDQHFMLLCGLRGANGSRRRHAISHATSLLIVISFFFSNFNLFFY